MMSSKPPAPAGEPATEASWAALSRFDIRARTKRLAARLQELERSGHPAQLRDFEVVRKLGDGANSLVFLAKCSGGGRLSDHTDTLLALKALTNHFKNQGPQAVLDASMLAPSVSTVDRVFQAQVEKEARGPRCDRDNIVHVLGTFQDEALTLPEYRQLWLEAGGAAGFLEKRTAFIVIPLFAGGDLQEMLGAHKAAGTRMAERTILSYLGQMLDAIAKISEPPDSSAHRDLKPDNIFFIGNKEDLALADFGEIGDLQLRFTKGQTSPGGAPPSPSRPTSQPLHKQPSKFSLRAFLHLEILDGVRRGQKVSTTTREASKIWCGFWPSAYDG